MSALGGKRGFKDMLDPAMGPCKRTMATRQIRKIKKQRFDEARRVETLPGDRGQVFEKMSAQSFYPHDVENLHGASLLQWIDTAGKDLVAESSIVEHHVHATSFIERLLSVDYPPIEDIVRCNVPVALIALCEICKSDPHGQNAINVATTCLNIFTKIASAGQQQGVDIAHYIENLSIFGQHPHKEVRRSALLLLLELADQNCSCQRNILENPDAVNSIFKNLDYPADASLLLTNISLIAKLSSATDSFPRFQKVILRMGDIIHHNGNYRHLEICSGTLQQTLEVLFQLSGSYEGMETLLSIDIVPKLVELLDRRHVAAGSLKILGNLSSGDNAQIQALVIESGAFAKFGKLIDFKLARLAEPICFILSNIATGTDAQRDLLLDEETGLLQKAIEVGRRFFRTREEVIHILASLCNVGKKRHVEATAKYGAAEKFIKYLQISAGDPALLCQVVKALERMYHLEIYEDVQVLRDALDSLTSHPSNQVSKMSSQLLTKIQKEDGEMENIIPVVESNGTFIFGEKTVAPRKLFISPNRSRQQRMPQKPFGLRGLSNLNK